jgi:UDP-2-acetamido-3-amino-2,3-dideoxy-glucuronate N-acetyltransferase
MSASTHPAFERDLALVGAGYWGKNLARNFNELGVLHTICDANAATLDTYGPNFSSVAKETDFERALKNPAVKKVAIAAPAPLHYRLAKAGLDAGKDIYVEKPLCLDLGEAEELVRLAETSGLILMVGHLLQYHPCVERLREMVGNGELGKLYYITSNRLNLGKIRREENALWSFAPHDISVILSLANNHLPDQVRCVGGCFLSTGVADTTMTTLRFAGGIRAHIQVSWLNPFKEQKLTVVGSEGMVVFDDTKPWAEKLLIYRDYLIWKDGQAPTPTKGAAELLAVPEAEPLAQECRHFLERCLDRRAPRTDGGEGVRVLRVLQAAQTSLEQDGEAVSAVQSAAPIVQESSRAIVNYQVHPTAIVDEGAIIGAGTKIWHFCHIQKTARIGLNCVIGQNVNIDGGVIGNNVKIQNNVAVYTGVVVEDDVFLGPSCVLTNVTNPRSQVSRRALYENTLIRRGATIGANATIVCGVTVGRYAFIAAGAVVTKDVPDYALVKGNPGRQSGWMSRHGHPLAAGTDGIFRCPESGLRYRLDGPNTLRCLDLAEDAPLPPNLNIGKQPYAEFKKKP